MDSVVIRRYKKGDETGIIELRNEIFDPSRHTDIQKWQWEYLDPPPGESKIFVYENNHKIVGHYGLIPILFKLKEQNVLSGKSEDAMIHKNYRAFGNRFIKLVKTGNEISHEEGMNLIWGFPNKAAFLPHIKGGFTYIGDVFNLMKIVNSRIILDKIIPTYIKNRYFSKIIIHLLSLSFSILNIFFNLERLKKTKNITIKSVANFDERINKLWEKANSEYGITIVRNCEYLNWRFVKNPYAKSKIFIAERENEILGYIVLGIYKSKKHQIKIGFISDLFFDKREKAALHNLLDKAIEYLKIENVAYISASMAKAGHDNKCFLNLFRKKGFLFKPRKLNSQFILKANIEKVDTDYVSDIRNWYITGAFGEGVRF